MNGRDAFHRIRVSERFLKIFERLGDREPYISESASLWLQIAAINGKKPKTDANVYMLPRYTNLKAEPIPIPIPCMKNAIPSSKTSKRVAKIQREIASLQKELAKILASPKALAARFTPRPLSYCFAVCLLGLERCFG
jgi:hypothetical protein